MRMPGTQSIRAEMTQEQFRALGVGVKQPLQLVGLPGEYRAEQKQGQQREPAEILIREDEEDAHRDQ